MLKWAESCRNLHTHTRIVLLCVVSLFNFSAFAEGVVANDDIAYKHQLIKELKNEISQIDSEMARCQKAKKGWIAATVVGGVGVVATGTAAIVQSSKLKEKEKQAKTEGAQK